MMTTPPSRNKSHHIVIHAREEVCILPLAHANSMALSISNLRLMPPTVTTAFAGRLGQSFNCPFETASRTAFSISLWAVTPNVLRNLRTLVLRVSSSMIALSWIRTRRAPHRGTLVERIAQKCVPAQIRNRRNVSKLTRQIQFALRHRQQDGDASFLSFCPTACD